MYHRSPPGQETQGAQQTTAKRLDGFVTPSYDKFFIPTPVSSLLIAQEAKRFPPYT
jgi:hypothetical protein